MKRALLVLAAAVAVAVACDRPGDAAESGTVQLTFWNGFSGPDGKAMEEVVRRFNAENRDIQVRMQIIPWGTYYDKLTLALAFGGAPEVFILHAARVPEYASHEALEPMDPLLASSNLKRDDFVPKTWEAGAWQGRRYGLPLDCHPLGMYYNRRLLEEAGIENPPSTYAEFIDAAKRMTKDVDGDGRPEVWGFAYTDMHLVGSSFLFQHGGSMLDASMSRPTFDSPATRAAIESMKSLIRERVCPPPGGTDGWMGFMTGKVAMTFHGIWMIDSLAKQNKIDYAAAPVPFMGPVKSVWAGSHVMCLPSKLNSKTRAAAWKFVEYLSDQSLVWAKGGQVPVRRSVLNSPEFQALTVQSQFARQLDYVQFEPSAVISNQISSFADAAFEACVNGNAPVDQALANAQRRIATVIRRQ